MSHSTVDSHQLAPGETFVFIVVTHNEINTYACESIEGRFRICFKRMQVLTKPVFLAC